MSVLSSLLWVFAGGGVLARESGNASMLGKLSDIWWDPIRTWKKKFIDRDGIYSNLWDYASKVENWPKIIEKLSPYLENDPEYSKWLFSAKNEKALRSPSGRKEDVRIDQAATLMLACKGLVRFSGMIRDDGYRGEGRMCYHVERILRSKGVDPFWAIEHDRDAQEIRLDMIAEKYYTDAGKDYAAIEKYHKRIDPTRRRDKTENEFYEKLKERLIHRWGFDYLSSREGLFDASHEDDTYYGLRACKIKIYDEDDLLDF